MAESKKKPMKTWWFRGFIVICDCRKSHVHYAVVMATLNVFEPNINLLGETSHILGLSGTVDLKPVWRP